jgi:hypothetical protein
MWEKHNFECPCQVRTVRTIGDQEDQEAKNITRIPHGYHIEII